MKKSCDYKRREIPKDCLSCAQSYSADDEDGNMILVCVKDSDPEYVVVPEDGYCDEWTD